MSTGKYFPIRSFTLRSSTAGAAHPLLKDLGLTLIAGSGRWYVDLELYEEADRIAILSAEEAGAFFCVVGDFTEVEASNHNSPYASATTICLNLRRSTAQIACSITALPPVFLARSGHGLTLSSPFLPERGGSLAACDFDGIADTLRWGHPIDGRTVFEAIRVADASSILAIDSDAGLTHRIAEPWQVPTLSTTMSVDDLIEEQIAVFLAAADRLPRAGAFVSLSGGLDSRTALVGMLIRGRKVASYTLSGSQKSLDARLAAAFCAAHGLEHHNIVLDAHFLRKLPDLILRTAALSGGVACLSQAVDLYMYESLPTSLNVRISGNFGNQVGRGGVESLSAYAPVPAVFSADVQWRLAQRPLAPWFLDRMGSGSFAVVLFGQEAPYWSIPNYLVGSSRSLQISPYAVTRLMQLASALFSCATDLAAPTWQQMRKRDLRHRLAGPPIQRSFQRQLLARNEKTGQRVPLNWGWYASGGRSPLWTMRATFSAADAATRKFATRSAIARRAERWLAAHLGHPSVLVDWPEVVRMAAGLTYDVLKSQRVRESGVFSMDKLDDMLSGHFSGTTNNHLTVSRALEIGAGMIAPASSR